MSDDEILESQLLNLADLDMDLLDSLRPSTLRDCLARMFVDNPEISGKYCAFQSAL